MKTRIICGLIGIGLGISAWLLVEELKAWKKGDEGSYWEGKSSIIHVPRSGCPKGSERLSKFFEEENGEFEDACALVGGNGGIDELKPGEGVRVKVRIIDPFEGFPPTEWEPKTGEGRKI